MSEAATTRLVGLGKPIEATRGIALYDSTKDSVITTLAAFEPAVRATGAMQVIRDDYGTEQAPRLVLQFVYEFLERAESHAFNDEVFEATWTAYETELGTRDWVWRGIANVNHLRADQHVNRLGDGVEILGRKFDELKALGFGPFILKRIADDWSGPGASSFVMVVESQQRKSPSNITATDSSLWVKAQRAIGAMRLLSAGDIGIGQMWLARSASFNVGLGGAQSVGVSIPSWGSPYNLTPKVIGNVAGVYSSLERLEFNGYERAPGNLDLALRSFMATYDRWPSAPDSRLLDSITALEAILGSRAETTFKLAFRVASLLARDDSERALLLEDVKGFYGARSALVHGGRLEKKHQQRLERVDDVRAWVRKLLLSFVEFAAGSDQAYDRSFFDQRLDAVLVSGSGREALRRALHLDPYEAIRSDPAP